MKNNDLKWLSCLALAAALTSGCTHSKGRTNLLPHAQPLPTTLAAEYAYAREEKPTCKVKVLEEKPEFIRKEIELRVANPTSGTNRAIVLEYYDLPGRTNSPVIMVLPMLGGGYGVERIFANYFAAHGYAVVIVHRTRIKKQDKKLEDINPMLKEMVLDHRKVIDWLETQKELDCSRLGVFGISMGGIKGSLLTPLEPRIQAAVLGLTGGDLPYILTRSTEPGIVKMRDQILVDQHLTLEQAEQKLRDAITCDPMLYAPYVDPKKVMLILARFDTVVPIEKGMELKEKMGNPELIVLPSGHYTAALSIPYVKQQAFDFFQKRFAATEVALPKTARLQHAGGQ